jgi:hypothetical protein
VVGGEAEADVEQAEPEHVRDASGQPERLAAERAHPVQQIDLGRAGRQPDPARFAAEMARGAHAAPVQRIAAR